MNIGMSLPFQYPNLSDKWVDEIPSRVNHTKRIQSDVNFQKASKKQTVISEQKKNTLVNVEKKKKDIAVLSYNLRCKFNDNAMSLTTGLENCIKKIICYTWMLVILLEHLPVCPSGGFRRIKGSTPAIFMNMRQETTQPHGYLSTSTTEPANARFLFFSLASCCANCL